jgi:RNA 3'-terminal phosphate cyclase (ATP)
MIEIDGKYGEGGGQIVRTSLALSSILEVPVSITDIRGNRKNPGLKPQHVTCVNALAKITGAEVHGAKLESAELVFKPRTRRSGVFSFNVADIKSSAGSVTLILQALLPPLLFGSEKSQVTLRGGTHVEWSPSAHYVMHVFLPMLKKMGAKVNLSLGRWGWYPKGKGSVTCEVEPVQELNSIQLNQRSELKALRGLSVSSKLPMGVAKRLRRKADGLLQEAGFDPHIRMFEVPAACPGTIFFLWAEFEECWAGFGGLGRRGRPAEDVSQDAVSQFLKYMQTNSAIEEHLADQLIIYMTLAKGLSSFTTSLITQHLLTGIWVVEQFLPVKFDVEGDEGEPGKVTRVK